MKTNKELREEMKTHYKAMVEIARELKARKNTTLLTEEGALLSDLLAFGKEYDFED